ncbi:toll/interleukin-1 receptor domain-containing protein [Microbacterium sp. PM5]|uniref:toll/interleukin-1 receptor domain-containing protein n=1 Tax=Microbacterium sp. PM5 TaxID=2014534 RepID=UPI000DD16D23|nr:toll/interleukin-1 receptor domain-containing protein [Microbacterium sp. PM5]AXA96852.1 hypothetical protein CEP17_10795 [Microbacterium sp. PM5]
MTAPAADGPDFFVSYTSKDQEWAEWIAWQLERVGYSTVIQAWDFRPGTNFVLEMDRAAGTAKRTLVVLSPNFMASRFTQPEWAAAFAKDPTGINRTILPVLVAPTETGGLLDQIVHINLLNLSTEDAAAALIAGVEPGRSKPATEPRFPGSDRSTAPQPRSRNLDWAPAVKALSSVARAEALPHGWSRSGPSTVEITLVPAEVQSLPVSQLEAVALEMVAVGRDSGLFTHGGAVDHAHTAEVAHARSQRDRSGDEAGLLVTRSGQRSAWITLPHDTLGSVLDPQHIQPRLASLLRTLTTIDLPLAERYGFTARVDPLIAVIVGDSAVVGGRNSASMGMLRSAVFPLTISDTVRGDAIASSADELAGELIARIVAAMR